MTVFNFPITFNQVRHITAVWINSATRSYYHVVILYDRDGQHPKYIWYTMKIH